MRRPRQPTADVARLAGLMRGAGFTAPETAALCGIDPAAVPADEYEAAFPVTERYSADELRAMAEQYYREATDGPN